MFDLEEESKKTQISQGTPAEMANVVEPRASRGLEAGGTVAVAGGTVAVDGGNRVEVDQFLSSAAKCRHTSATPNLATGHASRGLPPIPPLPPGSTAKSTFFESTEKDPINPFRRSLGTPIPKKRRWLFLGHCPFTRSMLERGAELWGEPLDIDDLSEIEHGNHYLFERRQSGLQDLLYQWADDNPGKMAVLLAEFYPESTESSTNNDSGPSR